MKMDSYPKTPQELDPTCRLAGDLARWRDAEAKRIDLGQTVNQYRSALQQAQAAVERATPESDMYEVAAEMARVQVLVPYLEHAERQLAKQMEQTTQAHGAWERAWREYVESYHHLQAAAGSRSNGVGTIEALEGRVRSFVAPRGQAVDAR